MLNFVPAVYKPLYCTVANKIILKQKFNSKQQSAMESFDILKKRHVDLILNNKM